MKKIEIDQLDKFLLLLRNNLVDSGLDGMEFDKAVESATRQLLASPPTDPVFRQQDDSGLTGESRGMDSLGRILVEFCFFRTPEKQMIWPDNTEQDKTARKMFTPEYIPRPLMRYFLASVRGSIATLDRFNARSFLTEGDTGTIEQRTAYTSELLEEFKGPFGAGESAIDWEAVYEDARFQKIAMELIDNIRQKLEQLGLEPYLKIINSFQQNDPDSTGLNAMQRPFTIDDARQIDEALRVTTKALSLAVD